MAILIAESLKQFAILSRKFHVQFGLIDIMQFGINFLTLLTIGGSLVDKILKE